jgi:molybdenum cofactor synthesis domain-containing protein
MTQIIPGVSKDARFRKGHIVTKEDIPILLSMGKENLYVWEKNEDMLHEDEAATILYELCNNEFMEGTQIKEGKITLTASCDGVFYVNTELLNQVNSLGEIIIATRHGNFGVKKGNNLAAARVIPLIIDKKKLEQATQIVGAQPLLKLVPYQKKRAAIIVTGNEVYNGRIQDAFGPVIQAKLAEYNVEVIHKTIMNDDTTNITNAIKEAIEAGAELITCTGGMSVDPDDTTPTAIKQTGATLVTYGAPVLPGAMFLLAYYDGRIPIMGLPGCVMYNKRTIFDLVLPRVIANEVLEAKDLTVLGEGGLCLSCEVCSFPNCGFGK